MDHAAKAGAERREQGTAELKQATTEMWARLPAHFQWLKNWEYV